MTQSRSQPLRRMALLAACVVLVLALAAAVMESLTFASKRISHRAQALADRPDAPILDWTGQALALAPWNPQALYLRGVRLKNREEWEALDGFLPRLLATHPTQSSVRRMAGETAFRRGEMERAADLLWDALWINPTPPHSPAGWWHMAMVASERAGREQQAAAAAIRALGMLERDRYLREEERIGLIRDAAGVLGRRGWRLTGNHLMRVAAAREARLRAAR